MVAKSQWYKQFHLWKSTIYLVFVTASFSLSLLGVRLSFQMLLRQSFAEHTELFVHRDRTTNQSLAYDKWNMTFAGQIQYVLET